MSEHENNEKSLSKPSSNVVVGSIWMVGLTLVLFFIPLINGLVAGLVGGLKVGSVSKALLAAILPSIVAGLGLWVLLVALDLPVLGAVAGLAAGVLIVLSDLGIFLGALIGGAISTRTA